MAAIGIDLGTTYSCVAAVKHGKVEIIANTHGKRITPSCVAFTNNERLIGDPAKHHIVYDPANTVYDVKRIIGRKFGDDELQEDLVRWQFKVVSDGSKPKIQVQYKDEQHQFVPEELSAMVLSRMKEIAATYLGKEVKSAVITVPAHFNLSQRKATKDAADIAGLHVLAMINEPTAAAFAYGLQEKVESSRILLVYDLGGGTFDVTILEITSEEYDVKVTDGDTHLGGQDFNERLVQYLADEFKTQQGLDIRSDATAMGRLRQECERVKIDLSTNHRATVHIYALKDGKDFQTTVTRAKFEELNDELFDRTLMTVKKAIEDAKFEKEQIDDVVLVGGSTKIPYIKEMLEDYFEDKEILQTINPDEAVAYGAAVRAAFLSGDSGVGIRGQVLRDVTPLSLGVGSRRDVMSFVVKRNTKIPCKTSKDSFTTVCDYQSRISFPMLDRLRKAIIKNIREQTALRVRNVTNSCKKDAQDRNIKVSGDVACQTGIGEGQLVIEQNTPVWNENSSCLTSNRISIYEGEREKSTDNHLLGTFTLRGITSGLAGEPNIRVCFELNNDGSSLNVTAEDHASGNSNNITISLSDGRLSDTEVRKLVKNAEIFRKEDKEWREKALAMNELQSEAYKTRRSLRSNRKRKKEIKECEKIYEWAEVTEEASMDEITQKRNDLEDLLRRIEKM